MARKLTESITSLARHSAVRFVVVGGISFGIDAATLYLLHGVLRLWLPSATVLAYTVAFGVNFGLNRVWAFGADGRMGRQLHRYLRLTVVNLVLTAIGVPGLTWLGLEYLLSKVVVGSVLALMNYVVLRMWVFHDVPVVAPVIEPDPVDRVA
jgi:putative flippase GtrA